MRIFKRSVPVATEDGAAAVAVGEPENRDRVSIEPYNPADYRIGFCGSCHYFREINREVGSGFCWRFPVGYNDTMTFNGCGEWTEFGIGMPHRTIR